MKLSKDFINELKVSIKIKFSCSQVGMVEEFWKKHNYYLGTLNPWSKKTQN